jgi:hypothetical protein
MRALFVVVMLLAVVALAACAALLRDRTRAASRVVSLFKRSPRPPRPLGSSHYYRRYWAAEPRQAPEPEPAPEAPTRA